MIIKPWKILNTKYLHPNVRVDECELPDGQIIVPHLLEYDDEIMVFALTKNQKVVFIEQYRHGVQEVILELPGGSVDDGESPLEAAKRELMEETGYASDTFIEVGCGSPNPAIYTNRIYSILAIDAEKIGKQSAHDAETVDITLITLDEVIAMAKRGDIINSLNISTIFFVLKYLKRIS
jgi:ADP-ribose pyrophosphatase